jgi:hypothetical protein
MTLATILSAGTALAGSATAPREVLHAILPVTPEQARELAALLRSPGVAAGDLLEVTAAALELVPDLPAAVLHDVMNAPARDLALIGALVTDTVDLVVTPGPAAGRYRQTLQVLHRSRVFTAAAHAIRRVIHPGNRSARLVIVLAARAHGLPLEARDLDLLRRAIDADAPDLGPLLVGVVERLIQAYGRDAVRLLLTR